MAYEYKNNQLHLKQGEKEHNLLVLAKKEKQPMYVYDLEGLLKRLKFFKDHTHPAHTHYAMKANAHPKILKKFCQEGISVDVVSGGEIDLALKNGFKGKDIVFSGVAKTKAEIKKALLADILQFNVESSSELKRIAEIATSMKKKARVALRMNPDIDLDTHPYIKTGLREHKFGLEIEELPKLLEFIKSAPYLVLQGLTLHIGSQIQDITPLKKGILKIKLLYDQLQKEFRLKTLDIGGGLGIDYKNRNENKDLELIKNYGDFLKELSKNLSGKILTEPGRIITARYGILIGEIQYLKSNSYKNFAILNIGMHHLIRPALYQAYHQILSVEKRENPVLIYDVVGPICESADTLGRDRAFSQLKEGDFLAVLDAGAYGSVMASNYNIQTKPLDIFL